MEKIKVAVVGLGHRGRYMGHMADYAFDFVDVVAACDVDPVLWHEKQWEMEKPMKELMPNTRFYEDYDTMLEKEDLDFVLVETGADVHAAFCAFRCHSFRGKNALGGRTEIQSAADDRSQPQ